MRGGRLAVELALLERRRVLDQLLRNGQANHLLAVVGMGERLRDRVPLLAQRAFLGDQKIAVDLDDVPELAVVAAHHFVAFHHIRHTRRGQTQTGMRSRSGAFQNETETMLGWPR